MNLQPVSVSAITTALAAQLRADHRLADVNIERSAEINALPSRCPWIGVYRVAVQYPSRTLGLGSGYRGQSVQLIIFAQAANAQSGAACEDSLESLVRDILSTLLTDPTIGGAVQTLDEIEVQYPDIQKTADAWYLQTAAIYITALGGVTAT